MGYKKMDGFVYLGGVKLDNKWIQMREINTTNKYNLISTGWVIEFVKGVTGFAN